MKWNKISIYLVIITTAFACHKKPSLHLDVSKSALIPAPKILTAVPGSFVIDEKTSIYTGLSEEVLKVGSELQRYLKNETGYELAIKRVTDTSQHNSIHLTLLNDTRVTAKEGYRLFSNENSLRIEATTASGLFRAFQTLKQLLPLEPVSIPEWQGRIWAIPGVQILDEPYYDYRGAMLDVSRHFFKVKDVKRYIDLLAQYKINTLHLHLSDDQGWRIEINSWPKLTTIGGSTAVGGGQGGFYTQEEYKEIVAYAAQKYITIIPEIDMPGHTNAALASYPELNCNGKATQLYTGMRVGFSSLCVDKEITYTFIDEVIRELAAITPGEYIHLGGDESHATSKKDYNLFLQKVFPIVKKYNKKVMGWEDIESAGLDSTMIVQHWTKKEKAQAGARQGARVVLSPAPYTYLDMKYNDSTALGLIWAGVISIEKAYKWSPQETLDSTFKSQVIGIESPLWSETLTSIEDIEFMAFPRIMGHAELGWSGSPREDTAIYFSTLQKNLRRFAKQKVNYSR